MEANQVSWTQICFGRLWIIRLPSILNVGCSQDRERMTQANSNFTKRNLGEGSTIWTFDRRFINTVCNGGNKGGVEVHVQILNCIGGGLVPKERKISSSNHFLHEKWGISAQGSSFSLKSTLYFKRHESKS